MRYQNYTVQDFLQDEDFVKWVQNPDEEADIFWDAWLQNHAETSATVAKAREILLMMSFPERSQPATDTEYEEVLNGILEKSKKVEKPSTTRALTISRTLWRVAASLLLPISAFFIWQLTEQDFFEKEPVVVAWKAKETPRGRRSTFQLPDGTVVKLNAGSALRYPEVFADSVREVYLEGEAFFDVEHNPEHPFVLHTEGMRVQVLGTSFNVKARPNDSEFRVALVSGKVSLEIQQAGQVQTAVLFPSEVGVISEDNLNNKRITKNNSYYDSALAWLDGTLIFEDARFEEIVQKLERWYGIDFEIQKEPKLVEGLNGTFKKQSLRKVLETLSHSSGFQYRLEDGKAIIF